MPKHEVKVTMPTVELKNTDAELEVCCDGKKLGTLRLSRGSAEWVPAKFEYGYHVRWTELAELFEQHGMRRT